MCVALSALEYQDKKKYYLYKKFATMYQQQQQQQPFYHCDCRRDTESGTMLFFFPLIHATDWRHTSDTQANLLRRHWVFMDTGLGVDG